MQITSDSSARSNRCAICRTKFLVIIKPDKQKHILCRNTECNYLYVTSEGNGLVPHAQFLPILDRELVLDMGQPDKDQPKINKAAGSPQAEADTDEMKCDIIILKKFRAVLMKKQTRLAQMRSNMLKLALLANPTSFRIIMQVDLPPMRLVPRNPPDVLLTWMWFLVTQADLHQ